MNCMAEELKFLREEPLRLVDSYLLPLIMEEVGLLTNLIEKTAAITGQLEEAEKARDPQNKAAVNINLRRFNESIFNTISRMYTASSTKKYSERFGTHYAALESFLNSCMSSRRSPIPFKM